MRVSLSLSVAFISKLQKKCGRLKPGRAKPSNGSIVPILIKSATYLPTQVAGATVCTERHLLNVEKCKT